MVKVLVVISKFLNTNMSGENSLPSVDAKPQPPRTGDESLQQQTRDQSVPTATTPGQEIQSSATTSAFRLDVPPIPDDWHFQQFLLELSDGLTDNDLGKLKYRFAGAGGLGKKVLEEITSPRDLFTILGARGFLTRDNQLLLQKALFDIGRMDLIEKGVHYANSKGDIPVFYPESSTPANGYRFVKWHVEGTDYKKYSRDQILSFRARVANALFIPPEYVLIAGVQPSSSLLIALMIPESYVKLFQMMLERDDEFLALQRLGVDVVEVGGKSYNLKGINDAELVETEQQSRLTTIYEQLEEKVKNLEKTEVEVVTLSRKVDILQEELKGNENKIKLLNVEVKTLRKVLKPDANEPVVSEILEQAMDNFKSVLDEVEKTNYDKTLIVKLLDTNTKLVSVGGAHSLAIKERGYNQEIARLNAMITPLQYKLARYQYATSGGPLEFDPASEKAFLNVLQTMFISAFPGVGSLTQTLTPVGEEILKNISMGLKQRDRKTILKKYTWHPNDQIKASMDADSSWFLAGIFYKELERHGNGANIDFGQFYAGLLTDIGRADLKEKLVQQQPEQKEKKNVPNQEQAAAGQPQVGSQQPTEFKQMEKQIADMHTWMESARKGLQGGTESWNVPAFDIPQSFKGADSTGAFEEAKSRTQSEKDKT